MTNEVVEKKPDLKELAKTLSDAYYNVLQYSNLTEENVRFILNQDGISNDSSYLYRL